MSNNRNRNKPPHRKCTSEAQKAAIRRSYAICAAKQKQQGTEQQAVSSSVPDESTNKFPDKFPFWARLKIGKNRTTLVIDKDMAYDKRVRRDVDGYVHREATSQQHDGFEEIFPNPDRSKSDAMYLKSPRKLPKRFFKPHNKQLDMPEHLRQRYDKNNHKDDDGN